MLATLPANGHELEEMELLTRDRNCADAERTCVLGLLPSLHEHSSFCPQLPVRSVPGGERAQGDIMRRLQCCLERHLMTDTQPILCIHRAPSAGVCTLLGSTFL